MPPTDTNSYFKQAISHFVELDSSLRCLESDLKSQEFDHTAAEVRFIRVGVNHQHHRFNVQFSGKRLPERKAVS